MENNRNRFGLDKGKKIFKGISMFLQLFGIASIFFVTLFGMIRISIQLIHNATDIKPGMELEYLDVNQSNVQYIESYNRKKRSPFPEIENFYDNKCKANNNSTQCASLRSIILDIKGDLTKLHDKIDDLRLHGFKGQLDGEIKKNNTLNYIDSKSNDFANENLPPTNDTKFKPTEEITETHEITISSYDINTKNSTNFENWPQQTTSFETSTNNNVDESSNKNNLNKITSQKENDISTVDQIDSVIESEIMESKNNPTTVNSPIQISDSETHSTEKINSSSNAKENESQITESSKENEAKNLDLNTSDSSSSEEDADKNISNQTNNNSQIIDVHNVENRDSVLENEFKKELSNDTHVSNQILLNDSKDQIIPVIKDYHVSNDHVNDSKVTPLTDKEHNNEISENLTKVQSNFRQSDTTDVPIMFVTEMNSKKYTHVDYSYTEDPDQQTSSVLLFNDYEKHLLLSARNSVSEDKDKNSSKNEVTPSVISLKNQLLPKHISSNNTVIINSTSIDEDKSILKIENNSDVDKTKSNSTKSSPLIHDTDYLQEDSEVASSRIQSVTPFSGGFKNRNSGFGSLNDHQNGDHFPITEGNFAAGAITSEKMKVGHKVVQPPRISEGRPTCYNMPNQGIPPRQMLPAYGMSYPLYNYPIYPMPQPQQPFQYGAYYQPSQIPSPLPPVSGYSVSGNTPYFVIPPGAQMPRQSQPFICNFMNSNPLPSSQTSYMTGLPDYRTVPSVHPGIENEGSSLRDAETSPEDLEKDDHLSVHYKNVEDMASKLYTNHTFSETRGSTNNKCKLNMKSCASSGRCIPSSMWCDGQVHCSDASDETHCPCRARIAASRICDGFYDCPLGEDELGCFNCGPLSFSCNEPSNDRAEQTCYSITQRCDGIPDCTNKIDEHECTMLHHSLKHHATYTISHAKGFLHRNFRGKWYPVCNNPYELAKDACAIESIEQIRAPFIQLLPKPQNFKGRFIQISEMGVVEFVRDCFDGSAVYITCAKPKCGVSSKIISQTLRLVNFKDDDIYERRKRHIHVDPIISIGKFEEDFDNRHYITYDSSEQIDGHEVEPIDQMPNNYYYDAQPLDNAAYIADPVYQYPYFDYSHMYEQISHDNVLDDYSQQLLSQNEMELLKSDPYNIYQQPLEQSNVLQNNHLPNVQTHETRLSHDTINTESQNNHNENKNVEIPPKRSTLANETTSEDVHKNEGNNDEESKDSKSNGLNRDIVRVVGGKISEPAEWPWVVAIYRDGIFTCGGTLISDSWVVSAAHCFDKFWRHYYEIQAGMLRRMSFSPQEQAVPALHIIVHEEFNKNSIQNDIALVKLRRPFILNRWVRPVCLPSEPNAGHQWRWGPSPGTACTAVGWGATVEHGPDPDHLRQVKVSILSHCKDKEDILGGEICAGFPEGGKDACQGDSGGPLLCKNANNPRQFYLAGIISHGNGCGRAGDPGVYTRVSNFLHWIRESMVEENFPSRKPRKTCPGFSCVWGIERCLPKDRRCNKVVDCLGAEDEINCVHFLDFTLRSKHTNNTSLDESNEDLPNNTSTELSISSQRKSNLFEDYLLLFEHLANGNYTRSLDIVTTKPKEKGTTKDHKKQTSNSLNSSNVLRNRETDSSQTLSEDADSQKIFSKNNSDDIFRTTTSFEGNEIKNSNNEINIETSTKFESFRTFDKNTEKSIVDIENVDPTSNKTLTKNISDTTLSRNQLQMDDKLADSSSLINTQDNNDNDKTTSHIPSEETITEHLNVLNRKEKQLIHKIENPLDSESITVTEQNQTELPFELWPTKPLIVGPIKPTNLDLNNDSNTHSVDGKLDLQADEHLSTHHHNIQSLNSKSGDIDLPDENHVTTLHPNIQLLNSKSGDLDVTTQNHEHSHAEKKDLDTTPSIENEVFSQQKSFSNGVIPARVFQKPSLSDVFTCAILNHKIPAWKRCNRQTDCEDGSDEWNCSCFEQLQYTHPSLLCDGYVDCADVSDENDCNFCPTGFTHCVISRSCVPNAQVCDNVRDCSFGEDETNCYTLSDGGNVKLDKDSQPHLNFEGIVTQRYRGVWKPICKNNWDELTLNSTSTNICKSLDFSNYEYYQTVILKRDVKYEFVPPLYLESTPMTKNAPIPALYEPTTKDKEILIELPQDCRSLLVRCTRELVTNVSSHVIVSHDGMDNMNDLFAREIQDIFLWPWIGKVYVDGIYSCSGVLVHLSWLLVEESCRSVFSFQHHHVSVVLGSKRSIPNIRGPYEQIIRVDGEKNIKFFSAYLLHLEIPAQYSRYVKPIPMPRFKMSEMKDDDICLISAIDERGEAVSIFLQPVLEECGFTMRCFRSLSNASHCGPSHFNAPQHIPAWAGVVVCHRAQGWYPAAMFREPHGECGFHGLLAYPDLTYREKDIVVALVEPFIHPHQMVKCPGVRCLLGQCVPPRKVCDGIPDCRDEVDESHHNCEYKRNICRNNPFRPECSCAASQLKCRNGLCIPKNLFANGINNCGDMSDEPEHSYCLNYLMMTTPSRICDGNTHCADKSDENPYTCKQCLKNHYRCLDDDLCVPLDAQCDGIMDCPKGDDESSCTTLFSTNGKYGRGEVVQQKHGIWHTKCFDKTNFTRTELESICRQMGYTNGHASLLQPNPDMDNVPIIEVTTDTFTEVAFKNFVIRIRNTDSPLGVEKIMDKEIYNNCHRLFVECI